METRFKSNKQARRFSNGKKADSIKFKRPNPKRPNNKQRAA
jgi:hypothetical protein